MLRIKGQLRSSATHRLSACALRGGTLFRRGSTDEFAITDWVIGEPEEVSLVYEALSY